MRNWNLTQVEKKGGIFILIKVSIITLHRLQVEKESQRNFSPQSSRNWPTKGDGGNQNLSRKLRSSKTRVESEVLSIPWTNNTYTGY